MDYTIHYDELTNRFYAEVYNPITGQTVTYTRFYCLESTAANDAERYIDSLPCFNSSEA